jgi:hypothetical protein
LKDKINAALANIHRLCDDAVSTAEAQNKINHYQLSENEGGCYVVAYFRALSLHLPQGTGKNYNLNSMLPFS